jgi:hypothetical protein
MRREDTKCEERAVPSEESVSSVKGARKAKRTDCFSRCSSTTTLPYRYRPASSLHDQGSREDASSSSRGCRSGTNPRGSGKTSESARRRGELSTRREVREGQGGRRNEEGEKRTPPGHLHPDFDENGRRLPGRRGDPAAVSSSSSSSAVSEREKDEESKESEKTNRYGPHPMSRPNHCHPLGTQSGAPKPRLSIA